MFLLDKTHWNNHSYLFGLMGLIFTLTDSDSSFSVSGKSRKIPIWNYYVIRLQIFILYFYAGLKKTETDWLLGYSMGNLSRKWVFDPFRIFLTNEQIDLYIVHIGGFSQDLLAGPMLCFDKTRPIVLIMLSAFHLMNSQLFSIGMFPYACLATMFIFCRPDSPRKLPFIRNLLSNPPIHRKVDDSTKTCDENENDKMRPNKKYYFFIFYSLVQLVLPYSHFITKGYNGWTQGAYGYSWDMMIHSFRQQHIKIMYKDGKTGEIGYLKSNAFMGDARSRWTMHPDMLKQYATCVYARLEEHNVTKPEIYFDVWKSMNERFMQRVYDPRIDIASYDWKWNSRPEYSMPLLNDLADWRQKLKTLEKQIENEDIDVTFVADFPGLELENYLAPDLDNTTIELMGGHVDVILNDQGDKRIELKLGEKIKLPAGEFHTVRSTGSDPSMYMYIYQNTTDIEYRKFVQTVGSIENKWNF
jgi:vitamin K-dependent gamma-carboxylase